METPHREAMGGIQTHNLQPHLSTVPPNCILTMLVMYLRWKKWTENQGKSLTAQMADTRGKNSSENVEIVEEKMGGIVRTNFQCRYNMLHIPEGQATPHLLSSVRTGRRPVVHVVGLTGSLRTGTLGKGGAIAETPPPRKKQQKKTACAHLRARVCVCVCAAVLLVALFQDCVEAAP